MQWKARALMPSCDMAAWSLPLPAMAHHQHLMDSNRTPSARLCARHACPHGSAPCALALDAQRYCMYASGLTSGDHKQHKLRSAVLVGSNGLSDLVAQSPVKAASQYVYTSHARPCPGCPACGIMRLLDASPTAREPVPGDVPPRNYILRLDASPAATSALRLAIVVLHQAYRCRRLFGGGAQCPCKGVLSQLSSR